MAPIRATPGVYVEETANGVRSISPLPTSVCAFIGRAPRGPVAEDGALAVVSLAAFERMFGLPDERWPMGQAVRDFFVNGGTHALVVRLHRRRAGSPSRDGIGLRLRDVDYTGAGLAALDDAGAFNLLCIPPDTASGDTSPAVWQAALALCVRRRAMLLVDPPAAWSDGGVVTRDTVAVSQLGLAGTAARNAALYFPRLLHRNRTGSPVPRVPCGAVAGVIARTDATRGVWKAPAGVDAALRGVEGLDVRLVDADQGWLNPLAVNCLRTFPTTGPVVWGARTLRGVDAMADEYKYVPVRRLALSIEDSVAAGIAWAAFERNDEALRARLRLTVGTFMQDLFRRGAFQGATPREAYFVKCDAETTTQADIRQGICNILIGFAPLKPAEFVVLRLAQATSTVA